MKFNTRISRLSNLGILLFVILFIYSSTLYPGGSQANRYSLGFDWVNNYWCNLMNFKAVNGAINPARNIAIIANLILACSVMLFFIQFANSCKENLNRSNLIKWSGSGSMLSVMFIFTSYHDFITIVSSLLGVLALIGIAFELYEKFDRNYLHVIGLFSLILLGANNIIYYSGIYLQLLPLLQKVTFLLVLLWIIGMNFQMNKE